MKSQHLISSTWSPKHLCKTTLTENVDWCFDRIDVDKIGLDGKVDYILNNLII